MMTNRHRNRCLPTPVVFILIRELTSWCQHAVWCSRMLNTNINVSPNRTHLHHLFILVTPSPIHMSDTVSRVPQSAGFSWESWLYLIRISTPLVMTISDYRIVKVHYSHLNWQNVFYSVKNSFVDISCLSLQLGWNDSQILCILLKLILNVLMDQLNLGL